MPPGTTTQVCWSPTALLLTESQRVLRADVKAVAKPDGRDDGVFWMSLDDFYTHFGGGVHLCRVPGEQHRNRLVGQHLEYSFWLGRWQWCEACG